ncbi:uncharacterized protein DSM5745_08506 [Aspergillus mulundensis]|uniref:Uncharacterized protein n=1 Tax=Aspergillus mulundensis TaxID=1810919 RepID=A0A3D8R439_9EURO|nr:hypothetical protein DSM5745_08506 [Aspergillus mulundensis]RDW68746.1 hypothetical protein DSM5745_08506 [Aspergillus mulundensis]
MAEYTIFLGVTIAKVGPHLPALVFVIRESSTQGTVWLVCPKYRRAIIPQWEDVSERDFLRCTELCGLNEEQAAVLYDEFSATPAAPEYTFMVNFLTRLVQKGLVDYGVAEDAVSRTAAKFDAAEREGIRQAMHLQMFKQEAPAPAEAASQSSAYDMAEMSAALAGEEHEGGFDMAEMKAALAVEKCQGGFDMAEMMDALGEVNADDEVAFDEDWVYLDEPIPGGRERARKRMEMLAEDWKS